MRLHRLLLMAVLAAVTAAPFASARAATVAETKHVTARLVADARSVEAGGTITVGIHKRITPRWHTYWKNSGDSGLATTIAWSLPQGATAGEILWPAPKRIMVGPVANYGYEDEVTLLTEIRVPANLRAGDNFPIAATVDWLVCEEICIPEQVTLTTSLPVVGKGMAAGISDRAIEQARAKLPQETDLPFTVTVTDGKIELAAASTEFDTWQITGVHFFATDWGVIKHAADQPLKVEGDKISLSLSPYELKLPQTLRGVLVLNGRADGVDATRAYTVAAPVSGTLAANPPAGSFAMPEISLGLALLFALLGGIILNLMPCVLPVLSIKVLSLINHGRMGYRQRQFHGLAYTAGVLACFAVFAAIVLAIRSGGAQLGWGFQFQSPLFVLFLAYLMFAVGLSQSGIFSFGSSFSRLGAFGGNDGYAMSFLAGALAAIVATPCTAPFMGTALGFAVGQPTPVLLAIFLALGLGLALPYLLLCYWPALLRFMPKPGPWMERLKQALAFPMYAVAIWLVWVLAQQAGADAVAAALGGMLLIAFGAWLFANSGRNWRLLTSPLAAASIIAAITIGFVFVNDAPQPSKQADANARYEAFTPARLDALRADGRPVFVNLTAAWCITCLVNERIALDRADVTSAFAAANVAYLKGDWTHRDPAITEMLAKFGRNGVPLYVFYPAGSSSQPVVLPQILTPEIVLREIGNSKTARN
jgi:thiol:disulfide interchange protein/DsbC/DsbD-like thiol-disulfide interchange protein